MISTAWKIIGGTVGGMAVATFIVYSLQYSLDSSRDIREKKVRFDDLIAQAEEMYCQNSSGGTPVNIKLPLDRAADLEAEIESSLSALDYLTLASVGASFWSHDRAHSYGLDGLRLAELNGDPIDIYSANLILGHIDFIEFRETSDEAFLLEARSHFQRAVDCLEKYPRTYQRRYFEGQIYTLWGTHEIYAENSEEGDKAIQLAAGAWRQLPQADERLNLIGYALQKIKQGDPPKLPCPSQIAISPPFIERARASEESVPTTQFFPEPKQGEEGSSNSLNERVRYLERELQSWIGSIPKKRGNPSPESQGGHKSDQSETGCSFTLINNTNFEVWLYINGFDRDDFKLPTGSMRRFTMPCGPLTLYRREDDTTSSWAATIFRKPDGTSAEPAIEITTCCMELVRQTDIP